MEGEEQDELHTGRERRTPREGPIPAQLWGEEAAERGVDEERQRNVAWKRGGKEKVEKKKKEKRSYSFGPQPLGRGEEDREEEQKKKKESRRR